MSRADDEAARRLATISSVRNILGLLRSTREHANTLVAQDPLTKAELLDGIAMAEISALRILDDEEDD